MELIIVSVVFLRSLQRAIVTVKPLKADPLLKNHCTGQNIKALLEKKSKKGRAVNLAIFSMIGYNSIRAQIKTGITPYVERSSGHWTSEKNLI